MFEKNTLVPCDLCLFKFACTQLLSEKEFENIDKDTFQLKFKKGEHLIKQGAKATNLIYLSQGIVKHSLEDENGKNLILTITSSPYILGGVNIFNEGTNLFSISAIEDCNVCMIDIAKIKETLVNNGEFSLKIFEMISEIFKASIFNFINLAHKNVNGKIADIFLFLSKNVYKSNKFTLSLTRKELSEFAGISNENVIMTLSKFNKEGILKVEGKEIEIIDNERLKQISKIG